MEVIKYRVSADAEWQSMIAIKGEPGENYVLTDDDKQEIANLVLSSLPVGEEVEY